MRRIAVSLSSNLPNKNSVKNFKHYKHQNEHKHNNIIIIVIYKEFKWTISDYLALKSLQLFHAAKKLKELGKQAVQKIYYREGLIK